MADNAGDRFNSSHAETSYGTYASGTNGGFGNHVNGHSKNDGNDEGWLSDFIGGCSRATISAYLYIPRSLLLRRSRALIDDNDRFIDTLFTRVRAAQLWDPELRKAFKKLGWELLPDLLQASSPPWMQSINLTECALVQNVSCCDACFDGRYSTATYTPPALQIQFRQQPSQALQLQDVQGYSEDRRLEPISGM